MQIAKKILTLLWISVIFLIPLTPVTTSSAEEDISLSQSLPAAALRLAVDAMRLTLMHLPNGRSAEPVAPYYAWSLPGKGERPRVSLRVCCMSLPEWPVRQCINSIAFCHCAS